MAQPRILILRAPGTNCDAETAFAFQKVGGQSEVLHLNSLLENPQQAAEFQVLCIPGGFSYGDDISAGRVFGNQIRHHLAEVLQEFRAAGKLILGICNGFQVLMKSGLLDSDDETGPAVSLCWNESGCYIDRWVHLQVQSSKCPFLQGIESMFLPIAHAEGRIVFRDDAVLDRFQSNKQLVLQYAPGANSSEPHNPNGSAADVAGMCDSSGHVLGLMPHPERYIDPTHHPQWTRQQEMPEPDGLQMFRNAVSYFT